MNPLLSNNNDNKKIYSVVRN